MMSGYKRHMGAKIDDLQAFALAQRWGSTYGPDLIRRFFTEFISHDKLVFDLWDSQGRVALALLLDKLNNPANDACFELLALRKGADERSLIIELLALAALELPASKSGFQIAFSDPAPLSTDELQLHGLIPYYDTFEMSCVVPEKPFHKDPSIIIGELSDCDPIYLVAVEAFAGNPDTSMPEEKSWKENFLASTDSSFLLWKRDGELLGYVNLVMDRSHLSAEIRTLGVVKTARNRGVGSALLQSALGLASEEGMDRCHLTVAVQNKSALSLYERQGFSVDKSFRCYRRVK